LKHLAAYSDTSCIGYFGYTVEHGGQGRNDAKRNIEDAGGTWIGIGVL